MAKEQITEEWIAARRAALPGELEALVRSEPGRVKSHYVSLPVAQGGVRGLTDDKDAAFDRLVAEGVLEPGFNRGPRKSATGWYPAGHPERQAPLGGGELGEALLKLIAAAPGHASSHYCRLPMSEGGVAGSQERKEKTLLQLITCGKVKVVTLARAVGRKTHELYPADESTV